MIGIIVRSKIGRLIRIDTRSGPVLNRGGDGFGRERFVRSGTILIIVEHGHEVQHFGLSDDIVLVEVVADREVNRSGLQLKRTGPVVVTFGTEAESSDTELIVDIGTTNPQCSAEKRAGVTVLRQVVLSHTTIVPHVAIAVNQCSDIINIQLCGTLCSFAHGGLGLDSGLVRSGLFANLAILGENRPR